MCQLCLKNIEETSTARRGYLESSEYQEISESPASFSDEVKSVYHQHCCRLTMHFHRDPHLTILYTPGIFHLSLQRLEAGFST